MNDKRREQQEVLDSILLSWPLEDLTIIQAKLATLDEPQRKRRKELHQLVELAHQKAMNELPQKMRFNLPPTGLIGRRASELLAAQQKQ